MPKEAELEAMICVCARSTQLLRGKYTDEKKLKEEIDIVWKYTQRVIEKKQKNREQANAWNKAHPEAHRKHSRDYARRAASKTRAYQAAYYTNVTKPKRQGEKGEKDGK